MKKIFLIVLCSMLCIGAVRLSAQTDQDTVSARMVRIDHTTVLEYEQSGEDEVQRLIGEVELSQDSIYMYCDTAIITNSTQVLALGEEVLIQQGDSLAAFADTLFYDGLLKEARLIGNVTLINGTRKLFTERLHYDLNTKIATYETPGTLTDGETQLSSKRGYYYTAENDIYFKDSVIVINPEFQLRADTLKFNTDMQLATFLGPTVMRTDSSRIYCEAGFYEVENKRAEFRQNAQYERGEQRATADVIRYDGENGIYTLDGDAVFNEGERRAATGDIIRYNARNDITELEGDAYFRDSTQVITGEQIRYDGVNRTYTTSGRSRIVDGTQILQANQVDYTEEVGLGVASGNVIWQDTASQVTIVTERADYNQTSGYLKAVGGARGRPMLITLIDGDSLYMTADTLLSIQAQVDTISGDSSRLLLAYNDVRLFKSDMQALCDSLAYNSVDSLFRLYREPIIWADTSQFTADTVHMQLADQKLDRIFLYRNAFILNSPDELYFNQIKGKDIIAYFDSSELRRMEVEGNAESVYYPRDELGGYVGVNKTICSEMEIFFRHNEVERIRFLTSPEGKLEPMGAVDHTAHRLEGFNWISGPRPRSLNDLFGPPLRQLNAGDATELPPPDAEAPRPTAEDEEDVYDGEPAEEKNGNRN